ncbi:Fungal Zn2-Cys6 binuclear cluster domain-containing protein [Cladophialophora immunda]|nr:Fungal Zn2-Cys6 binuclear cluster domain-containing protein [Cladophialophora immunda]
MLRPLAPENVASLSSIVKQGARKISTACGSCKRKRTKCTGGNPCEACARGKHVCIYDASSDQRRKVALRRNVEELASVRQEVEHYKQLLGGIIAIIRAGDTNANRDLICMIRSGLGLSQLAAHVRNGGRANGAIQQAYENIDFLIDETNHLPTPVHILNGIGLIGGQGCSPRADSKAAVTEVPAYSHGMHLQASNRLSQ